MPQPERSEPQPVVAVVPILEYLGAQNCKMGTRSPHTYRQLKLWALNTIPVKKSNVFTAQIDPEPENISNLES